MAIIPAREAVASPYEIGGVSWEYEPARTPSHFWIFSKTQIVCKISAKRVLTKSHVKARSSGLTGFSLDESD